MSVRRQFKTRPIGRGAAHQFFSGGADVYELSLRCGISRSRLKSMMRAGSRYLPSTWEAGVLGKAWNLTAKTVFEIAVFVARATFDAALDRNQEESNGDEVRVQGE